MSVTGLGEVDRAVLERYLAFLQTRAESRKTHGEHVGLLHGCFQAIRQHGWDDTLPATAMFYPEDYPKRPKPLPRALAEHVMAQVEHPDNLARWHSPEHQLITLILIRCGLRIGDALRLEPDCIAYDADGAPYLRYYNHKMKREALVPIDEQLREQIGDQQRRARERWPDGTSVLFPQGRANPDGRKALTDSAYRRALRAWLERCDIRDEHGHPAHLTPHQWRHTLVISPASTM